MDRTQDLIERIKQQQQAGKRPTADCSPSSPSSPSSSSAAAAAAVAASNPNDSDSNDKDDGDATTQRKRMHLFAQQCHAVREGLERVRDLLEKHQAAYLNSGRQVGVCSVCV